MSMISNGPNFNNGGFGINQQSTNFQQTSNLNPLAVNVVQGVLAKNSSTTALEMLQQQDKIEDKDDASKNMIKALIQINLEQHNVN